MNKKIAFITIAVFWVGILGGFVFYKEYTVRTGESVLLQTVPVDPRDLFRGDYVILRYDISTISTEMFSMKATNFAQGDTLYVLLDVNDGVGSYKNISRIKPQEGLFIKGTIERIRDGEMDLTYGIESYFVPEGEGREIERHRGEMQVKVVIDSSGNAVLRSLIIDGEEIK
jgi:uncharacterized membrane-anchored protein